MTYIAGSVVALMLIMSSPTQANTLKAHQMYHAICTICGSSTEKIALMRNSASGSMAKSWTCSVFLDVKQLSNIITLKELEVPNNISYNICMMNKKEEIKYKDLLDCDWAIQKSVNAAQKKYDEYYQAYGKHDKKDLLTELAYDDLKALREARKTLHKAVRALKANNLYTNGE